MQQYQHTTDTPIQLDEEGGDTQPQYDDDATQQLFPDDATDDDATQQLFPDDATDDTLYTTAPPVLVPVPRPTVMSLSALSPRSPCLMDIASPSLPRPQPRVTIGSKRSRHVTRHPTRKRTTTDWLSSRNRRSWDARNAHGHYTSRPLIMLNTLFAQWCQKHGINSAHVGCEVTHLATSASERLKPNKAHQRSRPQMHTVIRVSDTWLQQPHVSMEAVEQELLPHFATVLVGRCNAKNNGDRWLDTARRMGWEGVAHGRGGEAFVAHPFACTHCAHTCYRRETNATCAKCGATMCRV